MTDADIINVPIRPNLNSIKITRIDGSLEKKQKWNGYKWIDICRFENCMSDNIKTDFCTIHIKQIQNTIKDNEKRIRNGFCYRFDRGKITWKLMCSYDLCTNVSQNKEVMCSMHLNSEERPNTLQSSVQSTANFYNQILQDELNKKEQELIKQKKNKKL